MLKLVCEPGDLGDVREANALRARLEEPGARSQIRPPIEGALDAEDGTASQSSSISVELGRLAELHGSGALTDDEFAAAKAKVLGT